MSPKRPKRPEPTAQELPETITISELSELSQDVFQNFGIEAAALLNDYSCAVEDALVEQTRRIQQAHEEIKRLRALLEEHNIPH